MRAFLFGGQREGKGLGLAAGVFWQPPKTDSHSSLHTAKWKHYILGYQNRYLVGIQANLRFSIPLDVLPT